MLEYGLMAAFGLAFALTSTAAACALTLVAIGVALFLFTSDKFEQSVACALMLSAIGCVWITPAAAVTVAVAWWIAFVVIQRSIEITRSSGKRIAEEAEQELRVARARKSLEELKCST